MTSPDAESNRSERVAGSTSSQSALDSELEQVRAALRDLRFGSVNILVQDGVVVQIDRTEKRRLRQADERPRRH